MLKILGYLALLSQLFISCNKSKKEEFLESTKPPYCVDHSELPQCARDLASEQTACETKQGAKWDETHRLCQTPFSDADCQKISSDLVWDGQSCVSNQKPKNFYRYCVDPNMSDSIKNSIKVLSEVFKGSSCQAVHTQLSELSSMTYNGKDLEDISVFQGFTQLKELNLWNNKIKSLTPIFYLQNLEILNLGHNVIVDINPLSKNISLKKLYLFENQIINIAPLKELSQLILLDVRSNKISDFTPISSARLSEGFFKSFNPGSP